MSPPLRKPNFGRSFPVKVLLGTEQEVARVEHDSPRDFTVMLGDTNSILDMGLSNMPYATLLYGNGGVGNVTKRLDVPIRCSVYHVVASTVIVRAILPQDEFVAPAPNARFSANIGYGRPSRGETNQILDLGVGAVTDVEVMPWVTHLRIVARCVFVNPAFVAPSFEYMNITQFATNGLGTFSNPIETTINTGPGVAFPEGFAVPIPYVYTNFIRITANDLANGCEVSVTQYWQL